MPTVAFTPSRAGTIKATVAATTATITLPKGSIDQQIFVQASANVGTNFIEFGTSAITASAANSTPIIANGRYTFTVGPDVTSVATIGTASDVLYFTCGQGFNPN
jgi:hypothetical protein